jgi:glycosyltransferase involved in cell wall biosynthesis
MPKILYAGTLDIEMSIACHFVDPSLWELPLDVFGDSQGKNCNQITLTNALKQARQANKGLNWHGQVSAEVLDSLIPQYAFSLVFWQPTCFALLNAAPNKFFQALAHGVPVITAPHPQCKTYVDRYNCGLVMKDWSREELIRTINLGINLFGTSQYQDMVNGAKRAVSQELNWQTQMKLLMNKLQMKLTS